MKQQLGDQKWIIDEKYGYATISGYVNEQNLENEDWLISPKIALDKVEAAKMTIDHVIRYSGNAMTDCTVWVSEDYEEGNPNEATWNQIPTSFKDGEDLLKREMAQTGSAAGFFCPKCKRPRIACVCPKGNERER